MDSDDLLPCQIAARRQHADLARLLLPSTPLDEVVAGAPVVLLGPPTLATIAGSMLRARMTAQLQLIKGTECDCCAVCTGVSHGEGRCDCQSPPLTQEEARSQQQQQADVVARADVAVPLPKLVSDAMLAIDAAAAAATPPSMRCSSVCSSSSSSHGHSDSRCGVCFDADACVRLLPCGHRLCSECCSHLLDLGTHRCVLTCPFCRGSVGSLGPVGGIGIDDAAVEAAVLQAAAAAASNPAATPNGLVDGREYLTQHNVAPVRLQPPMLAV